MPTPSKGGRQIFLEVKQKVLQELHGQYGVPRIDPSSLVQNDAKKIGEGAFSKVFVVPVAAQSDKSDLGVKFVAVKRLKEHRIDQLMACIVPSESAEDQRKYEEEVRNSAEKVLQYYERECVIWHRCSGKQDRARENNLVEIFGLMDTFDGSHMPISITRYIVEGNVSSYVRDKKKERKLSNRERLLIVRDAAKALSFLHDLGIVHRDIKGRNILIERTGDDFIGLLCDFGSSKTFQDEEFLLNLSSTMDNDRWSPPEYLKDPKAIHNAKEDGDIWALGCTLLEILQEQDPWQPLTQEMYKPMLLRNKCPVRGKGILPSRGMEFQDVEDRFYQFMKRCWNDHITAKDAYNELLALADG